MKNLVRHCLGRTQPGHVARRTLEGASISGIMVGDRPVVAKQSEA